MAAANWADLEKSVYGARFSLGAETVSDTVTVSVQLLDRQGNDLDFVACLPCYLSSDADGLNPVAIPTSITAGTDGAVWSAVNRIYIGAVSGGTAVEPRGCFVVSEADGDIDIVVTGDTGADTVYVNLVMPTGQIVTSPAVVIAAD
jgi:hypothetical protein